MKKVISLFVGLIAVIIIGILALTFLPVVQDNKSGSLFDGFKNASTNAVFDVSGVKSKVAALLESKKGAIAQATGLSETQVSGIINDLDIESWKATTLPSDAVTTGSYTGTYDGVDAKITTYQDSGYVTVTAYGQDVTLEVPNSARDYLSYLQYL